MSNPTIYHRLVPLLVKGCVPSERKTTLKRNSEPAEFLLVDSAKRFDSEQNAYWLLLNWILTPPTSQNISFWYTCQVILPYVCKCLSDCDLSTRDGPVPLWPKDQSLGSWASQFHLGVGALCKPRPFGNWNLLEMFKEAFQRLKQKKWNLYI